MTEWHGWIYARKEQEQILRSFGVTGAMSWIPNEHREDWVDADGGTHVIGLYLKVAEGYFEQCIVKNTDDMARLMCYHPAFIPGSFTGVDEEGNHLPKGEQIYWKCPPPSIEEFATTFGIIMNAKPAYKETPLERTRAFLTDFGDFLRVLPTTVLNSAGKVYLRLFTNMYVKYLMTVCVHKWYVLQECIKLGIPWQGLMHDISKFRPSEFIPYARYFYDMRYGLPSDPRLPDFDIAWLNHQHRNKHHWQHWILPYDDGTCWTLQIPHKHLKEMLADWRGANKAYGTMPLVDWYTEHRQIIKMADHSREWIEYQLGISTECPATPLSPMYRIRQWIKNRRK